MAAIRVLVGVLLVALGLGAAGCGGSRSPSVASLGPSTTSTSTTTPESSGKPSNGDFIKFVHCMQSHGVNAQVGAGGRGVSISGSPGSDPQFQRAQKACQKLLPGGGPKPLTPAQQAAVLKQMVKLSKCMRAHGVANFPDPSPTGGIQLNKASLDPGSPQFQAAAKACQASGPNGKGFGFHVQAAP